MFLHHMDIYQLKITLMDVRSLIWRFCFGSAARMYPNSPFLPPQNESLTATLRVDFLPFARATV